MANTTESEKFIERRILVWLNRQPDTFAWKVNTTGIFDPRSGQMRKSHSEFVINGVSDILGIMRGRMIAFEVKNASGRPRPEQLVFIARIQKLGGVAAIVRSVEDVRQALEDAEVLVPESSCDETTGRLSTGQNIQDA